MTGTSGATAPRDHGCLSRDRPGGKEAVMDGEDGKHEAAGGGDDSWSCYESWSGRTVSDDPARSVLRLI